MTRLYFRFCYLLLGCAQIAVLVFYFVPIKATMHWDEVVRYAEPGIEKVHPNLTDITEPLTGFIQNGSLTVATLRLIQMVCGSSPAQAFLIYKVLIAVLIQISVYLLLFRRLGRNLDGISGLSAWALVLACPMLYFQENEIMVEPLVAALTCLLLCANLATWPRFLRLAALVVLEIAFLATSIQLWLAINGVIGLTTVVTPIFEFKSAESFLKRVRRGLLEAVFFSVALILSFGLWALIHGDFASRDFFVELAKVLFGQSAIVYGFLTHGMTDFDRYFFGVRDFFWLYFPAVVLWPITLFGLYQERSRFEKPAILFTAIFAVLTIPVFAKGYAGNPQSRYHFPHSFVLLICIVSFTVTALSVLVQKLAIKSKPAAGILATVLLTMTVFDYNSIFQERGCFGNLQICGPYINDHATCENVVTSIGIARDSLVTFPLLTRALFSHSTDTSEFHFDQLLDQIQSHLREDRVPIASSLNPNFLNTSNLQVLYVEKFGKPPPQPRDDSPFEVFFVALPRSSAVHSTCYEEFEEKSTEKTLREWQTLVQKGGGPVFDVANSEYVLKILNFQRH